ncbi:PilN domain-containing protein [Desulfotomaculum copahuensis]|uniref:Fimbrial assembly protein n=1 Tax=Desulfotomaculum copahuensis TaxID=1838280 RepID=A0A1B7LBE0_9FIRM|nr:PilN domain-containing protein [Desulfotomaculum copahuensis]OAT79862.1 hypothetical protein A6M21_14780 [Desulfotomaculum copahuensis]
MNYRINLLPLELQPRPPVEGKRLAVISGLTVLAALILIGGAGWLIKSYNQRVELAVIQSQLASLSPVVRKVEADRAEEQKLQAGAAALEELLARHRVWKPVLDDIAQIVPVDIWLSSVDAAYDKDAAKTLQQTAALAPGAQAGSAGGGAGTPVNPAGSGNSSSGTAIAPAGNASWNAAAGAPGGAASGTAGNNPTGTGANPPAGPVQQAGRVAGQLAQRNQAQQAQLAAGEAPAQQKAEAQDKVPLPPNVLTIKGTSRSFPSIGVFVRKLSVLPYFRMVSLKEIDGQEDGTLIFTIVCYLQTA